MSARPVVVRVSIKVRWPGAGGIFKRLLGAHSAGRAPTENKNNRDPLRCERGEERERAGKDALESGVSDIAARMAEHDVTKTEDLNMATPSNVIHVPRPPSSSYNPNRPLAKNTLILSQVKHFREIEKALPPDKQTGIDLESITTEGRAAEYIRALTTALQPKVAKSGGN
jgi:hypothetical protein